MSTPRHFATFDELYHWLATHAATGEPVWIGLHKVDSGIPSVTWPQVVDACLCFGWIDGHRKSIDADRWMIRITPRKPDSNWSNINVRRFEALRAAGKVHPAGEAAHALRATEKTGVYSFESPDGKKRLLPDEEAALAANPAAWAWWQAQPPGYKKGAAWWLRGAKQEATRLRRLETLIDCCARGTVIPPYKFSKRPTTAS